MPSSTEYLLEALSALSTMQFVEEVTRMYLVRVYALIQLRLGKTVDFKYDYSDVKKDSLGKLLTKFERHSDKTDLIEKLKKLPEERNFLAHEAFLLTEGQWNDTQHIQSLFQRAKQANEVAKECLKEILEEVSKIDALLATEKN